MGLILERFKVKFEIDHLLLFETEYWAWSLRPVQTTLGAGILSLKRECTNLSNLNKEEFEDLFNIIPIIEKTIKKAFNYDVMNYLMLMMIDKHVHYHIIPRYERIIEFAEIQWEDKEWPKPSVLSSNEIDYCTLQIIVDELRRNILAKV